MGITGQKYNSTSIYSLSHLIFPTVCQGCGYPIHSADDVLCLGCFYSLPRTHFHRVIHNPIEQKFWGRIPVERAFSFLHFERGNLTRTLLHALKYHGKQGIGESLGRMFGRELREWGFTGPDYILPLPLHKNKLRSRGYNQCDSIAQGMSVSLGIPVGKNLVERVIANPTQTKKGRYERWENVKQIFEARKPAVMRGKHILLIDDVITTGSTMEACGHAVLFGGAAKVSMASIASA